MIAIGHAIAIMDGSNRDPPDVEAIRHSKVEFVINAPLILLQTLLLVFGFIGICRRHLPSLQSYTVISVIYIAYVVLCIFISTSNHDPHLLSNIAALVLMYFIISELGKANGMALGVF